MGLESIADISVSGSSRGVARASFSVPLVLGRHDAFPDRVREYTLGTATTNLVTDGIPVTHPIWRAVNSLASPQIKCKTVLVGRLITSFTHLFEIIPNEDAIEEGAVFAYNVVSPDGTITEVSYTALDEDDLTAVLDALETLTTAIVDLTAANGGSVLTCEADNEDEMWRITGYDVKMIGFRDTTADSALVTEFLEINEINNASYGVILADPNSKDRVTPLAVATEAMEKIFGYTTHDTAVGDATSETDVMYMLNAADYFRTFGIYSGDHNAHAAATWIGDRFPTDPGSSTWAYKDLPGVIFDDLPDAFIAAIKAKKGNYYTRPDGSTSVTLEGRMASGEWIDVVRFRDWLVVRLRERTFSLFVNTEKVPFTDPGAEQVGSEFSAQMDEGITAGGLAADPEPLVTVPKVADVPDADKIERTLPGIYYEATLAGSVHNIRATGVLNV